MIGLADPARPQHVGALLSNSPEMLRAMAAAALGGYVLCGLNTTRRGDGQLSDIRRSDCQPLLVDPDHQPLLAGLDLLDVAVIDMASPLSDIRRYRATYMSYVGKPLALADPQSVDGLPCRAT